MLKQLSVHRCLFLFHSEKNLLSVGFKQADTLMVYSHFCHLETHIHFSTSAKTFQ